MRKCPNCGNSNFDTDKLCDRCGMPLPDPIQSFSAQPQLTFPNNVQYQPQYVNRAPSGLSIAVKVFMILSTCIYCIGFITSLIIWAVSLYTRVEEFVVLMFIVMISSMIYAIVSLLVTRSYFAQKRNGEPIKLSLKIVSIFLFGILTFIFMILDDDI